MALLRVGRALLRARRGAPRNAHPRARHLPRVPTPYGSLNLAHNRKAWCRVSVRYSSDDRQCVWSFGADVEVIRSASGAWSVEYRGVIKAASMDDETDADAWERMRSCAEKYRRKT